ncbi:carboxypeptidase regulatory-like domain-containing protein [Natrinema sp. 1APR25-10V2]|uniref:carboxypeptidase regulatory-like domain-containing protein n=1 Tax=Natrinema sp. 1APR25-10V2 TaxID=2951081 RepID=UPI00287678E1|nr:carboxypeptidase regulatory-like domain-containing protein [Natrinema sp. 1APR25-10V2]MDS0477800.1 carboxypeptidase-like regulatory domain-containing protein [Natrinema sp. 1APR25-10V2]
MLGTVRDETNDPIENATIAIRSIGAETVTGPDGAYETVVPRERHTLEVNATGYYIRRVAIEAENRESIEQNVTLVPKRNDSPNETTNRSTANETPVTNVTNNVTDDADSDSRTPASERSSVRFRVIDLLLFAVLFLGALVSATLAGLYRNRSDRP